METGSEEGSKSVWLVGASEKSQMLGAALCGLGRWGPRATPVPQVLTQLGDLEELLFGQAEMGTLIVDYDLVPVEDIGFVRRFLERHSAWRMLVVGAERGADSAARLLNLPSSSWLSWPPNLDEVNALLSDSGAGPGSAVLTPQAPTTQTAPTTQATPASSGTASQSPASPPSAPPASQAAQHAPQDLGKLFKELLINEHLAGHKWNLDFQEGLTLPIDQRLAKLSFGAFINLARACSGREGVVKARLSRAGLPGDPPDTACLQLDFSEGELKDHDQDNVLRQPIEAEGKLGSSAKAALIAAEALRKRGGRVALQNQGEGNLRLEMHISTVDLEVLELERLEAAAGHAGDPEAMDSSARDPFA